MAIAYNTSIIRNGLVLYLDAANSKSYPGSGTTWTDLSGNGNNGTLTDGPTFNTNFFTFDGLNDRVHVSSPSDKFAWTPSGAGLNSISIEVWVKTSDSIGRIFSKPWNGNGEYNWWLETTNFYTRIGNQSHAPSFTSLATGVWSHIVAVLNPTQKGVYKNGAIHSAFVNHSITNNTPANGNGNVNLSLMSLYPYSSGWAGDTNHAIAGDMAQFKIYNRALTAAEVQQNFEATRGRYGI
jgi:hypothetical protein